ncbi:MAG: lysylphosphatidylglycerol synthase domain-containing protein [Candidatus Dormibacteraceae bacterium]
MRQRVVRLLGEHWVVMLGLIGVAALIVAVDPAKVTRAVAVAEPRTAALMLPVVLTLYFCHGVAWWIALRRIGTGVGLRQAVKVTLISQAFDVLPGGDLWRVPIVRPEDGSQANAGLIAATVIFDDLVYFFVLTFAMVPLAVTSPIVRLSLAIALVPQLAIFTALLCPPLYSWLAGRVVTMPLFRRFQPQLAVLGPSFRRLVVPRVIVPVVLVDGVCAVLAIALYGLAMSAMHVSGVGLAAISFTYATGQVVSGLTVIPGALGAYEGMMTGMMAVQGVPPALAAAGALLYRVVNDVFMALIGLTVALSIDREYLRRLRRPVDTIA